MFQGLSQGATIPVFYKNIPRISEGRVVSVNTHMPVYNPQQPMAIMNGPVTDITVQVGEETIPFAGLPANGVMADFPSRGLFIATDRSAIQREVELACSNLRQDLDSYPAKKKLLEGYEALKLEVNPELKKDAQHAKEIESIRTQVAAMDDKFDRLMSMLSANLGTLKTEK